MHAESDPLAHVTAELRWLQALARAIVRGRDADDLAHDTWLIAAEHTPPEGRPLRPWLGRVALNLARMQGRARRRRAAREAATEILTPDSPRPDDLVARVELQRMVAGEVLKLAEPFRSTLLLHYFDELSCAEIARRLAVPEGTVRRRLKVALDELRARIADHERTRGGLAALVPLLGPSAARSDVPFTLGVVVMKKLIAAIAVLIVVLLAAVMWKRIDREQAVAPETGGSAAAVASVATGALPAPGTEVAGWLGHRELAPVRVAGRVTFRGVAVHGATVELASIASEAGLAPVPRRVTDERGEFDFGPQAALAWSVRASAPGKASATLELDLQSPTARRGAEHLELELGACDAAIAGTIRDASGGPIAKATVARLPLSAVRDVPGGPAVVSDDHGAYEMCVQAHWPGWIKVEVSAEGYAAITLRTLVPGRIKVDFALVPEATIVGRVVRADTGAPVAHAYAFVPAGMPRLESTPLRGAFTDSAGRFRLDRIGAGRHVVFARADGLADPVRGTPVTLGVGQTSVEIEVRLEAGATIRGKVVEHGKPVAGATVATVGGAQVHTTAVSQDDGSFVLTGVPRGDIRFSATPYDVVAPQVFHVTEPAHDGVTIEVESRGRIIGHVVRGKQPVAGANIDIHGPNDGELDEIRADASGRFEARGLQPGPWTLYASDEDRGAFGRAPETVNLGRGQTAEITIDLAYAGAISGRVVDQQGAPVPGVTVEFRNTASDDAGITATLADGTFRAATMTGGGQYRPAVTASLASSARLRPAAGGEFPLIALSDGNAEVTGIVLAVQLDRLSIAGRVVDSDGAPVPDARVVAVVTDGTGNAPHGLQDPADTTTVDGQFAIHDLSDGVYAIHARSAAGVETVVTGVQAGRSGVAVVLPAPGAIEVAVSGFASPPQVAAVRTGTDGSAPTIATPSADGYAVRNLSPGGYLVTASTATEAASAVVQVAPGRTARVALTSGGSGVVAGHVRELRTGKPVEGITCVALPRVGIQAAGTTGSGVRTDAQGAFLIDGAPAGPIAIECGGLWRNYSDGVRMLTLSAAQRADVDVAVVAWSEEPGVTLGWLGADLDDGVLIPRLVRVQPAGPAAAAGLAENDVIVAVDGAAVTELSPDGVRVLIVNRPPGSKVKLDVLRGAKPVTGQVTLGAAGP